MFPKIMRIACVLLALICIAMTAADFWNMSSPNLRYSMGMGIGCTLASWVLYRIWTLADRTA